MALKSVLSEMFPEIFNIPNEPTILSDHSPEIEILFPPRAELMTLHELAIFGRMVEIENFITQLKAMDTRYSAFARKVQSMTAAFDNEQILELIKSHLGMDTE